MKSNIRKEAQRVDPRFRNLLELLHVHLVSRFPMLGASEMLFRGKIHSQEPIYSNLIRRLNNSIYPVLVFATHPTRFHSFLGTSKGVLSASLLAFEGCQLTTELIGMFRAYEH